MKTTLMASLQTVLLALTLLFTHAGCAPQGHQTSTYGPIHQYAKSGDATAVSAILASHPEQLNLTDDLGQTPLHVASAQCHGNVVTVLLAKGAALEARAKGGPTPLHLAAQGGCAEAVNLLLAKGAQVNARDDAKRTPLTRASQWHRDAIVVLLRQHGGTE